MLDLNSQKLTLHLPTDPQQNKGEKKKKKGSKTEQNTTPKNAQGRKIHGLTVWFGKLNGDSSLCLSEGEEEFTQQPGAEQMGNLLILWHWFSSSQQVKMVDFDVPSFPGSVLPRARTDQGCLAGSTEAPERGKIKPNQKSAERICQ